MKIRFVRNKRSRSSISNYHPTSSTSSSDVVADNDNLLIEILIRLPIKSLIKFKCVSKHWLSIITNPHFARRRCPASDTASGLFLHKSTGNSNPRFKFLPLNHTDSNAATRGPFKQLTFGNNHDHILTLLQSCNGLLLCGSFLAFAYDPAGDNYVYNPTTKHFTTLPKLPLMDDFDGFETCNVSLSLAFDPPRSPHYKVVSVRRYNNWPDQRYRIDIYSSNAGPWRQSSASVINAPDEEYLDFQDAVYWNGAIYWITPSLCFHIDQEQFKRIPLIPMFHDTDDQEDSPIMTRLRYFGESYDHLHLIESYKRPMLQLLHIYEMERDHSAWSVKYCVDLDHFSAAFPETVLQSCYPYDYYAFAILCLVRSENDNDSFLVLHIPGKAVRYNLYSKTVNKICDFPPPRGCDPVDFEGYLEFKSGDAFQFIESLCYV